jgi:hypothetical protein
MVGRLQDKIALVVGAGSIEPGWGNGKATPVLFARRLEGGLRRCERGRCERNRVRSSPTQGRRKIMKRFDAVVGTRIAASLAGLAVALGGAAAQQSPSHHIVPLK